MTTTSNRERTLKQLVDGVKLSKEIITTAMLTFKPEAVVPNIEANYKRLDDLFKNNVNENGFLDITATDVQLEVFRPHVTTMGYIINIALATYKIFSETQLDCVLKSLFTTIVPANTDIKQHILTAYSELVYREAWNKVAEPLLNYASLVQSISSPRSNHFAVYHTELDRCEEGCMVNLEKKMAPMSQNDFIMLWERAFNSMVRQSRDIRDMFLSMPKELLEASLFTDTTAKSDDTEPNNNDVIVIKGKDQSETVVVAQDDLEEGEIIGSTQEEGEITGNTQENNSMVMTQQKESETAVIVHNEENQSEFVVALQGELEEGEIRGSTQEDMQNSKEAAAAQEEHVKPIGPDHYNKQSGTAEYEPNKDQDDDVFYNASQENLNGNSPNIEMETVILQEKQTADSENSDKDKDEGDASNDITSEQFADPENEQMEEDVANIPIDEELDGNDANIENGVGGTLADIQDEEDDNFFDAREDWYDPKEGHEGIADDTQSGTQVPSIEQDEEIVDISQTETPMILEERDEGIADQAQIATQISLEEQDKDIADHSQTETPMILEEQGEGVTVYTQIATQIPSTEQVAPHSIDTPAPHNLQSTKDVSDDPMGLDEDDILPPKKQKIDGSINQSPRASTITQTVEDFFKSGAPNPYIYNKLSYEKYLARFNSFSYIRSQNNTINLESTSRDSEKILRLYSPLSASKWGSPMHVNTKAKVPSPPAGLLVRTDENQKDSPSNVIFDRGDISSQEYNPPATPIAHIPSPITSDPTSSSLLGKRSIDDITNPNVNYNQHTPQLSPPLHDQTSQSSGLSSPEQTHSLPVLPSTEKQRMFIEKTVPDYDQLVNIQDPPASSSTISRVNYVYQTTDEIIASNVSSPYVCKKTRYRTSMLEPGSYTRRRRKKGL
ncbi:hypothetical protein K501DRAFT_337016 [Backusella circina FSU 941]|nr:hypothetical protein K501DRAFT_337016 [Backusella circina FSU 941]